MYKILQAQSTAELEKIVNEQLKERAGWTIAGGVCATSIGGMRWVFHQAMIQMSTQIPQQQAKGKDDK